MTVVKVNVEETNILHKSGNYYLVDNRLYILAWVDMNKAALISSEDGNRLFDATECTRIKGTSISNDDFAKLLNFEGDGHSWTKVGKLRISYSA